MRRFLMFAGGLLLAACGGSDPASPPPPPPPPAPVNVTVLSGSLGLSRIGGFQDTVTVHVRNTGGSGDYYLEFWGYDQSLSTYQRLAQSQSVNVSSGYDESVSYLVSGVVDAVKAESRSINTAVYLQTSCYAFNAQGVCQ